MPVQRRVRLRGRDGGNKGWREKLERMIDEAIILKAVESLREARLGQRSSSLGPPRAARPTKIATLTCWSSSLS